jgi:hypothetical protein
MASSKAATQLIVLAIHRRGIDTLALATRLRAVRCCTDDAINATITRDTAAVRCSTSPSSHTPIVSLTIYMIPIMYITR